MPDNPLAGERLIASVEAARAPFTLTHQSITANTPDPPAAAGAEAVWVTTAPLTFRTGRAYKVTVKGLLAPSATGSEGQIRVRKSALGGSILFDSFRVVTPNSGNYAVTFENVFVNTTGATITASLVGTVARSNGAALYAMNASVTSPAYLRVEDVGPATDYPGATVLS